VAVMSAIPFPFQQLQPDNYLVIDIETGYAPDDAISGMVDDWQPPGNIKDPEKIQARRAEFEAEARVKSALTDAAPIIAVAIKGQVGLEQHGLVLHAMGQCPMPALEAQGVKVVGATSEGLMLQMLSAVLGQLADNQTLLAGHNVLLFDLPKLRNRLIRNRAAIPVSLQPGDAIEHQPVYDTMKHARYFSAEAGKAGNNPFFGFKRLEQVLGLSNPGHKGIMSGEDVPVKHAEAMAALASGDAEKHAELATLIVAYNFQDVVQEEKAFRLMTGRY